MSAPLLSEPVEIGLVDYGMGNRRSVEKALAHVGARAVVSSDPDRLAATAGLVLPGVGAFPKAMENLKARGLDGLLRDSFSAGVPILGICLGMQLAFDSSQEQGGAAGLGLVGGEVRPLRTDGLKLPHIGWNEVELRAADSPLVRELPLRCAFYHVHSLAPVLTDPEDLIGTATYGEAFVTAVQHGSFYGVQFHPEKSSAAGLRMLANFGAVCMAGKGSPALRAVKLYPAIDILGGNAVRLEKGDFDASTVYDADPLDAALSWAGQGAERLHVVDLDGAKAGKPVNVERLRAIASETGIPVQYGGGLRSLEAIDAALEAGAARVVIGTAAMTDPALVRAALEKHGPERVLVGVDVRDGGVATHGWLQASKVSAAEALTALHGQGVQRFAFTDIDHDGMLDGPDLAAVEEAARAVGDGELIVSGGIGTLDHLRSLASLREQRGLEAIEGVIVGKALYERRFTVAEAKAALGA